ncbi:hypothetical protein CFP56_019949 [Quercus suber]|uniref:Uncharacterized protein n=1 Tax=Quercus suber TaxID=58331 RepID=A0AAW0KIH0_QUESU
MFKQPFLKGLESQLGGLAPTVNDINRLSEQLDLPQEEQLLGQYLERALRCFIAQLRMWEAKPLCLNNPFSKASNPS